MATPNVSPGASLALSGFRMGAENTEPVALMVGGKLFVLPRGSVLRYPTAFLAELVQLGLLGVPGQAPLFLDRHPRAFEGIEKFYSSEGTRLERPWKVAKDTWKCELRFFRLVGLGLAAEEAEQAALDCFQVGRPTKAGIRQSIWDLLEDPSSSRAAKVAVAVSVLVIVLSIFSLCAETVWPHTALQLEQKRAVARLLALPQSGGYSPPTCTGGVNCTLTSDGTACTTTLAVGGANCAYVAANCSNGLNATSLGSCGTPGVLYVDPDEESELFQMIEFWCIMYFTVEYLVRLFVTDGKCAFLKNPLNIIDVLAIAPWYIGLVTPGGVAGFSVVRVVRLVRVFRIFKLGAHVQGLTVFKRTLLASIHELGLLLFFVGLAVLLFGCVIYYVERETDRFHAREADGSFIPRPLPPLGGSWKLPSHVKIFDHILVGFWWTLCTMTSLGYGEIYPSTYFGYIVGGVASLAGLITLALPMVIIGQNFSENFRLVQQEAEDAADAVEAAHARSVAKAKSMMRRTKAFKSAVGGEGGGVSPAALATAAVEPLPLMARLGESGANGPVTQATSIPTPPTLTPSGVRIADVEQASTAILP
jgi:hypothetical protein